MRKLSQPRLPRPAKARRPGAIQAKPAIPTRGNASASENSQKHAEELLQISSQLKLGALITESSHPVTANLSEAAKGDIGTALGQLFEVDGDVIHKYREFVESGRAPEIQQVLVKAL